jgi:hypothetical protein
VVVAMIWASNLLSITERISTVWPIPSSPLACITASRAAAPVPQGERSRRPGWITVPLRSGAPAAVRAQNMT